MVEVAQPVVNKFQTGGLPDRAIQMSVFLIHLIISLFKKRIGQDILLLWIISKPLIKLLGSIFFMF